MMSTSRARQGRELAVVSWVLGLCAARAGYHAADAASVTAEATRVRTAPSLNYQALFKSPWDEDSSYHGLRHLEHVNICIPRHSPAKRLYYDLLGFAPDARRAQNIIKGSGTIWANMGSTQVHLPEGEPQVVPGTIGLVYDDLDFDEAVARLKGTTGGAMEPAGVSSSSGDINGDSKGDSKGGNLLESTKFAWQEERENVSGEEEGEHTQRTVSVTCPYGNIFRLHERKKPSSASPSTMATTTAVPEETEKNQNANSESNNRAGERSGASALLDPRGGRLPNVAAVDEEQNPYPPTLGLGISYVSFRVKPGTSAGIARFYREIFSTEVEEVVVGGDGGGGDGSGREGSCATEEPKKTSCSAQQSGARGTGAAAAAAAVVRVGPVQHLEFIEEADAALHAPEEYDGHHICVYLSEEGFRRSYMEAERRGLVFVNPRRNFGKADTLEKALEEKQFRVKDMVEHSTIAEWDNILASDNAHAHSLQAISTKARRKVACSVGRVLPIPCSISPT
ncbi:unnamed protein product [Scytosiphon promiscuus]